MKLATVRSGRRDGALVVVSRDLSRAVSAERVGSKTLQSALEQWPKTAPELERLYRVLNRNDTDAIPLDPLALASPLPRAYQWLDGSAYLSHVERVRKARGAAMLSDYLQEPLMYQGGAAAILDPRDSILLRDESWGLDFEAEIAVITDDVPVGVTAAQARGHIKLLMLVNDVSLRHLIPAELAKGFGFLQGKPGPAFSPVAVTPDELGYSWDGTKVNLPLVTHWNGVLFGRPEAGVDMQFDFPTLIAHAAKTRPLPAGTIIGSGTVSNRDASLGYSCIVEKRVVEQVESGNARTSYMQAGDTVRIEMLDQVGHSIFGAIEQRVRIWQP